MHNFFIGLIFVIMVPVLYILQSSTTLIKRGLLVLIVKSTAGSRIGILKPTDLLDQSYVQ